MSREVWHAEHLKISWRMLQGFIFWLIIVLFLEYLLSITLMERSKRGFAMCLPACCYEVVSSSLLTWSFCVSFDLVFSAPLPLSLLGRASGLKHSADCFPDGLGCSRTQSYSSILPTWVDLGDTPCKRRLWNESSQSSEMCRCCVCSSGSISMTSGVI